MPKQFCDLDGRPVLMTTIERMRMALPDAKLLLVLSCDWVEAWKQMCHELAFQSPEIVMGGETRWQSVRNAIEMVSESESILVHDGARPLVYVHVIEALMSALESGAEGAIPGVALSDSIRQLDEDGSSHAVDRSRYRAVQTPQAFPAEKLIAAYKDYQYEPWLTDDASVMEHAGYSDIRIAEGDYRTMKITMPADIETVRRYMQE